MWIIKSLKDGQCYNILAGRTYTVGRKDTDILIHGDPSVSRCHASFIVKHAEEYIADPSRIPIFELKDESSKYGTFKNGHRISDSEVPVKNGDTIKFGQFESEFSVRYSPIIITTSCIDVSKKAELKKSILQLGGHLVPEWRPCCTHLVMTEVKITVKALCCMISLKPLVLPSYFSSLENNVFQKQPLPDINNFIPPSGEPLIDKDKVSFDVVPERKAIFKDRTFVFLDEKQYKKMYLGITSGGGCAKMLNDDAPLNCNFLTGNNLCIVQPSTIAADNKKRAALLKKITSLLHKQKKRLIPESDFGLAVCYCSTEQFCNPDFNMGSAILGNSKIGSQTFSQQEVYVMDTATSVSDITIKTEKPSCIEETVISRQMSKMDKTVEESQKCSSSSSSKRKLPSNDENAQENTFECSTVPLTKKIKTEDNDEQIEDSKVNIIPENLQLPENETKESVSVCVETFQSSIIVDTERKPSSYIPESNVSLFNENQQQNHSINNNNQRACSSNVSSIVPSGFHSTRKNMEKVEDADIENDVEEDLPKNLVVVRLVDLVKRKPASENSVHDVIKKENSSVKNFKKFKKVLPFSARILPRIIGHHQLQAHDNMVSPAMKTYITENQLPKENESTDDRGNFDWDSQENSGRRR